MQLSALFILEVMIAFSFVVTSIFMFKPKNNPTVNNIFFWLAVALSLLITIIDATSLPTNYTLQIIIAWCGLAFSGIAVIAHTAKGKPSAIVNVLVMASSVYGMAGYFLLA